MNALALFSLLLSVFWKKELAFLFASHFANSSQVNQSIFSESTQLYLV